MVDNDDVYYKYSCKALLLGLHPRLGVESPVGLISQYELHVIFDILKSDIRYQYVIWKRVSKDGPQIVSRQEVRCVNEVKTRCHLDGVSIVKMYRNAATVDTPKSIYTCGGSGLKSSCHKIDKGNMCTHKNSIVAIRDFRRKSSLLERLWTCFDDWWS